MEGVELSISYQEESQEKGVSWGHFKGGKEGMKSCTGRKIIEIYIEKLCPSIDSLAEHINAKKKAKKHFTPKMENNRNRRARAEGAKFSIFLPIIPWHLIPRSILDVFTGWGEECGWQKVCAAHLGDFFAFGFGKHSARHERRAPSKCARVCVRKSTLHGALEVD